MTNKKLAIIHFYPLEFFPPITNLLNFFSSNLKEVKVEVYTTHNNKNRKAFQQELIKIRRYYLPNSEDHWLLRSIKYAYFYLSSLFFLILKRPNTVLYYETISSWPVYIYKKYFNRQCKVIIHFHEYASQDWYSKYMKLVNYFHKLEVNFLFNKSDWISQTNHYRLKLFSEDNPKINLDKLKVLPNYPPKSWAQVYKPRERPTVLKIIYIGSLSFEGTYIQEFCHWINSQTDVVFDIYSYNVHEDVKQFFNQFQTSKINFFENGIEYENIANILSSYDVGVILHRAYNENYKYNATNKLFEYLICDIDVWFPVEMVGCQQYATNQTWPKVVGIDFENLKNEDFNALTYKKELIYKPKHFYYENAFKELMGFLKNSSPK